MKLNFLLFTLILLLLSGCNANHSTNGIYTFNDADLLIDDSLLPPKNNKSWVKTSLPKYLRKEFTTAKVPQAWLRLTLNLNTKPKQLWSIFPTRHQQVVQIFLNNHELGQSGSFSSPISRGWNTPYMVNAPSDLWKEGENIIHFRIMGYPGYGKLNPVLVGPNKALQAVFDDKTFWQLELTKLLTLLTAMVALYNLSFWLRRNNASLYGYFGLAAAFWALYDVNLWLSNVPMAPGIWVAIMHSSIDWFIIFIAFFSFRLCNTKKPIFEKVLLAWGVLNIIVLLVSPLPIVKSVSDILHFLSILLGIYIAWFTIKHAIKTKDPLVQKFAIGILITILLGLHDFLFNLQVMQVNSLKTLWLSSTYLLQLGAPLLFIIMSWHLTGKFFNALDEAETLNIELEDRIDQARNVVESLYQEKTAVETKQATENERNRIYRDLHDDVGAKILNIVHRAENDKESDYARSVLKDLRDVVSNTGGDNVYLMDILADAREETSERLQTLDIIFDWNQPLTLTDVEFDYNQNLSLRRIIRESISNIIRHAQAKKVLVTLSENNNALHISIHDDGIGIPPDAIKGRGLSNIELRANKLGGDVKCSTSKQLTGTCMNLNLFLSQFKKVA